MDGNLGIHADVRRYHLTSPSCAWRWRVWPLKNFGLKLLSPVGCLRVLSNTAALQMLLS